MNRIGQMLRRRQSINQKTGKYAERTVGLRMVIMIGL
jgi:hypothetical protein